MNKKKIMSYPWSELLEGNPEKEVIDIKDVETARDEALAKALKEQDTLQKLSNKAAETFDSLRAKIAELESQLKAKEEEEQEEKVKENKVQILSALDSAILTQIVIARRKKIKPDELEKFILTGVVDWLQQRHKVYQHLQQVKEQPESQQEILELLNTSKPDLVSRIHSLCSDLSSSSSSS